MTEELVKEVLDSIQADEKLGREEWSGSAARKTFRKRNNEGGGWAPVSKFKPPKDSNEISVNRMGFSPDERMARIGVHNAKLSGKAFWGWYILSASDVKEVGCEVRASPLLDNPYHADIMIPVALDAEDRRLQLIEFARDLAYYATFQPWGDWTKEVVP